MWGWHLFWPGHILGLGLFGFLGPLFRLLVLVGVVVAVVFFVRRGPGAHVPRPESAQDILRRRYANGEISKEEFEQKMKDLG
jgi:putative membrane protein